MDGFIPVAEVNDELWEKVLRVNPYSVFYTARKVVPIMLRQGGGVIVDISSVIAFFAGTPYAVSRVALPRCSEDSDRVWPVKLDGEGLEYVKRLSSFMLRLSA